MATGLRDEIKTMRGRRQDGGSTIALIDGSLFLPPFRGQAQEGEAGTEEDSERGQAVLGLRRCTNSGNCLSSKRRSFSSQGSNWGCQTEHLHGNDYFYFVARLSRRPHIHKCSHVDVWTLPNEVLASASNQSGWLFHFCNQLMTSSIWAVFRLHTRQIRPQLYYLLWNISTFFVSACEYSLCSPLLILHSRRFKCERGELQGMSVLSFAAVSSVHSFVPKAPRGFH